MKRNLNIMKKTIFLLLLALNTAAMAQGHPVRGRGRVQGVGQVQGQGLTRGQGRASGTGVVFYRDQNGRIRQQHGTGTVQGRGLVIGAGRAQGHLRAAGRGQANL